MSRSLSDKLQTIKLMNQLCESDISQVLNYFTMLASAFNESAKSKEDFLQKIMDSHTDEKYSGIGIPGTLLNAYLSIVQEFEAIENDINNRSQQVITKITNSIGSLISDPSNQLGGTFTEMEGCVNKIDGVRLMVNNFTTSNRELIQNFAMSTNLLIQMPDCTGEIKRLDGLFKDVMKIRNKYEKNRVALIKTAQMSIVKYRSLCNRVTDVFNIRITVLTGLFKWFADIYNEMGQQFISNSDQFTMYINQMNFESDFSNFLSRSKIIRYDIKDLSFTPIDMSGPAFDGITPSIPREISIYTPFYLALITRSYKSDGENELTIVRGKYLLLMEEPNVDWVYSMNPKTRCSGFVPKNCFKVIGNKLGILIREFNEQSIFMNVGEYLGILNENDKCYIVENTNNNVLSVQKSFVGIIHVK